LKVVDSVLNLIGNTPMVRLGHIPEEGDADIFVKLEYLNPSGSMKDRIALEMIRRAEANGKLKPGYTIIEAGTGNTGPPLASWVSAWATGSSSTCRTCEKASKLWMLKF